MGGVWGPRTLRLIGCYRFPEVIRSRTLFPPVCHRDDDSDLDFKSHKAPIKQTGNT